MTAFGAATNAGSSALGANPAGPATRRQRQRRAAASVALALAALAAAYGYYRAAVAAQVSAAQARSIAPPPVAAPSPLTPDVVASLPLRADLPTAVATLQAAADRHGVALQSHAATQRAADATHLGWTEWVVSLRGRYAAIREVLHDMSTVEPVMVLQAISLRARNSDGELDAEVRWRLPVRPVEPGR